MNVRVRTLPSVGKTTVVQEATEDLNDLIVQTCQLGKD